jgi:hypothetical protein
VTAQPQWLDRDVERGLPCGFRFPGGGFCGVPKSHPIHEYAVNGLWYGPEPMHFYTPIAERRKGERRQA